MDIWQLKYFYTVAKEENLTRAARALNITQPALSISIAKLEDELGCQLFDRYRGRVQLNSAGRELMNHVPAVINSLADVEAAMGKYNVERHSTLPVRFSSHDSLVLRWLVQECMSFDSNAILSCDCQNEQVIIEDLDNGRIDFAVVEPTYDKQICWTPLITERMVLYVNKDHRFANKEYVLKEDLRDIEFIQIRAAAESDKRFPYDFHPRVIFQTSDPAMAIDYVHQGFGVALLPEYLPFCSMPKEIIRNIATIPVRDFSEVRTLGIMFKKGIELYGQAQEIFDFVATRLMEIAAKL